MAYVVGDPADPAEETGGVARYQRRSRRREGGHGRLRAAVAIKGEMSLPWGW